MKKGVQMFTVRDYMNDRQQVERTLRTIREIGYDSIQAATPEFMTHREFKGCMERFGLGTYSANADFETMRDNPAEFAAAVEQAEIYGVSYIAIGTLPEEMRESPQGYRRFAEQAGQVGQRLLKDGIRLLYHPHALEFYSFGKGLKGMDILMDETDPKSFHFSLDTHWLACGGVDICDWLKKAKDRMELVHFKDYAIVGGANTVETVCKGFAEVGEGNIDWPKVIDTCRETGVQAVAVEQDVCPGNPFDSLRISFENMVKLGV